MLPLVSIGMPVFRAGENLELALRSLVQQTLADWELILIDDASPDGASRIASSFADPRIRVVTELENKGLAIRLNQCIDLARGKYFARMDADDIAYPHRLARQVEYLESHAEVDLLGSDALVFRGVGEALGIMVSGHDHESICQTPWSLFPLPHPTWMGRMEWFRRHGYRDTLRKGQDQELLLRSYRSSRFAALDELLLGYRSETVSLRKSMVGRYNFCRSQFRLIQDVPTLARACHSALTHSSRFLRDAMIVLVGLQEWVAGRRWVPLAETQREEWGQLWQSVQAASAMGEHS